MNDTGRRYRNILFLVAAVTFVICVILMIFFRTEVITKTFSRLISILMPFIYGFVLAYLMRPVSLFLEKGLKKICERMKIKKTGPVRMISILLTLGLVFLALFLLGIAIIPGLVSSVTTLVQSLNRYVREFEVWLESFNISPDEETNGQFLTLIEQAVQTLSNRLSEWLQNDLLRTLTSQMSRITASFSSIMSLLKNFGLGMIVSVYLLSGWEKFRAQGKLIVYSLFPEKFADWIRQETRFINQSFSGFISGKIIDSAIIGLICFIFTVIAKLPYGILVSVIVGVTNIIPFFGPYLGAVPSALLILTESPMKCLFFVIFIVVLQQVDGNVIGPRILGGKVGLSSFWILFAILFFGALWGLAGMIVGVPIFAVAYDLVTKSVSYGLHKRKRTDLLEEYRQQFPPSSEGKEDS